MPTQVQKYRSFAFKKQNGRCYYCGSLMWTENLNEFAINNSISLEEAKILECTAEHVVAKCDGGKDNRNNIVAACMHCNRYRHWMRNPLSATNYKKYVKQQISKKKWPVVVQSASL